MVYESVSVIIPTYNRNIIVLETLEHFNNQSIKNFELIVIDQTQNPDNRLIDFTSEIFNYIYIKIEEVGLPNARNVAANKANGEILIFVDDDVIPDPTLIEKYIFEYNKHPQPNIIIGGKVIEYDSIIMNDDLTINGGRITFYGKTKKNFSSDKYGNCHWVVGCNFSVRKCFLLEIGGFDKNYKGNAILEDCDFCFNAKKYGGRVLFSPKPMLVHLRAPTGGTRQSNSSQGMFYRSHNTVYFFRKYGRYRFLLFVFIYLNSVALKDWVQKKHGISAFIWTWIGFYKGLVTKLNK